MESIELLTEFEQMRDLSELKALLNLSLNKPLTDKQFKRVIELRGVLE